MGVVERRKKRKQPIVNYDDPTLPFSHTMLLPGAGMVEHEAIGKRLSQYDPDRLYDLNDDPVELKNLATGPTYKKMLDDMKGGIEKIY